MARWRVTYVDSKGESATQEITASEKWTQNGLIVFVNREVVGSFMRTVPIWEIEEERVTSAKVVSG
ncbi:MAG: hypothetical protein JWO57_2438 [Pseudonocardiales bacterium]|nr:hypothetical protein [Pseudonocardiales bacterium]